ncbi:hypothetical protein JCM11641_001476 [Rhodosporidiobolus odoratus]
MPSSSLPPPVPEASDAAVEADQPTTFKRKKRPQGRSLSFKIPSGIDPQSTTDRDVVDGDAEADAAAELEADGTSSTLDSLLALRRLKRSTAGLDLERLNAGERKKRAKREEAGDGEGGAGGDGTVINKDGMLEGTNGGIQQGAGKDRLRDDGDAPEAKARKIVKSDNFTGQTNTVDVDKHMLAYIDAELARKRAPDPASAPTKSSKPHDPRDDLYRVSDKYKFDDIVETEKSKKDKDEEEGNVTLSASMLMGIPEVDLGIDIKLRNIEATEKAKRKLQEDKAAAARRRAEDPEADEFATASLTPAVIDESSDSAMTGTKAGDDDTTPTKDTVLTVPAAQIPPGGAPFSPTPPGLHPRGHSPRTTLTSGPYSRNASASTAKAALLGSNPTAHAAAAALKKKEKKATNGELDMDFSEEDTPTA